MGDALGERMKSQYEFRARYMLPRRTYTVIRIDGRAFHTYTRTLYRPFDEQLVSDMGETAKFLCEQIEGARLAYTQSDEISLVLTDFGSPTTQAWFDGNVQKIASVAASAATAKFNALRPHPHMLAMFDARVFTIPDVVEVGNYLVWRQQDAVRNSISMAAQAHFSHKALQGKSSGEMQEMLFTLAGVNWNDYDPRFKRGTVVVPVKTTGSVEFFDSRVDEVRVKDGVERREWTVSPAPTFTQDREWLSAFVPGWRDAA